MKREVNYYLSKGDGAAVTVWMDREMIELLGMGYGWSLENGKMADNVRDLVGEILHEAGCDE
jgi:hypothetical protein